MPWNLFGRALIRKLLRPRPKTPIRNVRLGVEGLEERTLMTTVGLATPMLRVTEAAGSATVGVVLDAPTDQTVSIAYSTYAGSATPGMNYQPVSGTLSFSPGQTSQSFSVPIYNDPRVEGDENLYLTLSSPINATLGSPANRPTPTPTPSPTTTR